MLIFAPCLGRQEQSGRNERGRRSDAARRRDGFVELPPEPSVSPAMDFLSLRVSAWRLRRARGDV
jgi:hypothetical protein